MVSAVDTELDVVLGLELGAADYVTKPFRLRELSRWIQAVLRRVSPPGPGPEPSAAPPPAPREAAASSPGPTYGSGPMVVDFAQPQRDPEQREIYLSRREFDLLDVLLAPPGQVRTRDELIDLLWPHRELSDSRTLDTHVHRLRAKLEPDRPIPVSSSPSVGSGSVSTPTVPGPRRPDGTQPGPTAVKRTVCLNSTLPSRVVPIWFICDRYGSVAVTS